MTYDPTRQALPTMPSAGQLGGAQPLPFVRFPFFPTAPWYSTNPNVGYQVRYYSTGIISTDTDYASGSESTRTVSFDMPVRVIAVNGAAIITAAPTTLTEQNMNLQYLFRVQGPGGDLLHVSARLASTVVGTMTNPGELGGHGYNVDQGSSLVVGITPLAGGMRIDITFVCLEMRAPQNFQIR